MSSSPVGPGTPPAGPSFYLLKSLVRQSSVYGFMDVIGRAGVLILVPLYTHVLGTEEYGRLELFVVSQGFLLVFGTLGFNSALTKYYVLADTPEEGRAVFGTAATWTLLWGAVYFVLSWTAAPLLARLVQHDPAATGDWRILSGTVFFEAVSVVLLSLFRSQERPFRFSTVSLTRLFTTLIVSVILVGKMGMGIRGALLGTLSGSIVATLLGFSLIRSYFRPRVDGHWIRKLFQLGFPLAVGGLAMFFLNSMDRYFINAYSDAAALGVYALANRISVIMTLVVNAFMMAWPPILFRIVKEPGAGETLSRVVTYYVTAGCFVLLGLTAGAREVVAVLSPVEFAGAAPLVGLLLGANLLYGVYYLFTAGPVLHDRTRYIPFIVTLAALVGVGGNFLLVRELDALGAALARIAAFVVLASVMFAVSQRMYRIPVAWRRLAALAVLVAVLVVATHATEALPLVPRVGMKAVLVLLYVPGLFVTGVLDREESRRLRRMLRRFLRRRG